MNASKYDHMQATDQNVFVTTIFEVLHVAQKITAWNETSSSIDGTWDFQH